MLKTVSCPTWIVKLEISHNAMGDMMKDKKFMKWIYALPKEKIFMDDLFHSFMHDFLIFFMNVSLHFVICVLYFLFNSQN